MMESAGREVPPIILEALKKGDRSRSASWDRLTRTKLRCLGDDQLDCRKTWESNDLGLQESREP